MYRARVDKENKILFVELDELFGVDEILEATKDFWIKIAGLGRGAFIVCDIRKYKPNSRGARISLQKVLRLVDSYEPTAVIRILDSYVGAMHFDRAYCNVGAKYKLFRVDSMQEAMNIVSAFERIPPIFKAPPSHN